MKEHLLTEFKLDFSDFIEVFNGRLWFWLLLLYNFLLFLLELKDKEKFLCLLGHLLLCLDCHWIKLLLDPGVIISIIFISLFIIFVVFVVFVFFFLIFFSVFGLWLS